MDETRKPRRRLNIVAKTARTLRIFERLREGWAYDDIAKAERLSAERVRQIVAQVLERRVVDSSEDHAHLQLERLRPALKLAGDAVKRGDLSAIGPLIKIIDRLDRHRIVFKQTLCTEEEYRKKLLDKLNWAASNLEAYENDEALKTVAAGGEGGGSQDGGEAARKTAGPMDFFAPRLPISD
jgi:hypothetical protein